MTTPTPSLEERKRRLRNLLFGSLVFLVVIWIFKLSHPQFSIISAASSSSPSLPAPDTTPKHHSTKEKWHSKPTTPSSEAGKTGFLPSTSSELTIGNKAAVIIETTFRQNLIPLILHFSAILGPSWPILLYTSAESVGLFSSSSALKRYIDSSQIEIRILPQTVLFTNAESVSAFLTNTWIWDSLEPAEHILLFESDSMLCANAARSVEDYFEYSFVGAPIKEGLGKGYNGGLSLRKRSAILRVLENYDWEQMKKADEKPGEKPSEKEGERSEKSEDQWFYNRLKELQEEDEESGVSPTDPKAINLPSMEVARTFSVESIDYPHPLGVHQVHKFQKDQLEKLNKWCPEYKLCSMGDGAAA